MTEIPERRACLTGLGQSDVGRRLGQDPLGLTHDACIAVSYTHLTLTTNREV